MKNCLMIAMILFLSSSGSHAQVLDDYFKIAAENNPGLQAKYKAYEAAMQKVAQADSLPDPAFTFGYFISPVETRIGPQKARLSLTQMFPWFGTLTAQGDTAALMAEAGFQAFIDARNTLYFQVASAYYSLYELSRWKGIEQENIEILQSYKALATGKFENGVGTMVDVLRVDIKLKDAAVNLGILNAKEKPLMAAFNNLLNRDVNEPVSVSDSLDMESLPDKAADDLLLVDNPVLKELDFKIKAGKTGEQAAYKQGLPRFGVGLDYIIVDKRSDMTLEDNGKDALIGMVTVNIPLFRAKYNASVKEAQLMQKSYSLQKQEFANSLTTRYEMAWFEIQQQQQLLALYEQQIQTIRQARGLLFSAYSNSGKEFEELLGIQQQLLSYDKMKITAEVQYQIGLAKLNVLTGRTYSDEKQ